jgi:hypothetical protein
MQLKEKIVTNKPREKSGSITSSRYDFQKDWSICKLIECHQTLIDYVIVFDWHEDLIIMDSESNPHTVSFYQIKGRKSGNWTVNDLIRSEKDKNNNLLLSIIGKLYDCKLKHSDETLSLNFVSNARFNVPLSDKTRSLNKDNICIIELSKKEKEEISKKIIQEHNLNTNPIFEEITFLKVLDLSLNDSKTHTQGKITDFFDAIYPGKKLNAPNIYRMIFDEVKRRVNYNKEILTYDDLLTNKSICKSQFERIIEATRIGKDNDEIWKKAESILLSNGLSFQKSQELKQSWNLLEVEMMNPNNSYLQKIIKEIKSVIEIAKSDGSISNCNLLNTIESINKAFHDDYKIPREYNENFIKAIILSEIYE